MAQCPGGIEGGAGVFSGESEEPQYIPFLGSRTEITSGVIHILRDFSPPTRRSDAGDYREDVSQEGGCRDGERVTVMRYKTDAMDTAATVGAVYRFLDRSVVLILAIPCLFSPSDLLHFVGPKYTEKRVERIRLLRDAAPNRYISLIKFDGAQSAEEFIAEKHGKCFSPLEPEICLAVLVSSVEISTRAPVLEPLFEESEFAEEAPSSSLHSSEFIQIPTCPVCLERIDSSATGIVIIVCNHKFHCQCLSRWGDSSCPVCRFALNKSEVPSCAVCACPTDIWVCLICGHTGCGRYQAGHAADHFLATGHNFALELDSHRVWDYVGDNYVHRLIQNKEDGKLVEIPGPSDPQAESDSWAAYKPEVDPDYYSSLLVAQLESQRMFYEGRIEDLEVTFIDQIDRLGRDHLAETRRLQNLLREKKQELEQVCESFQRQKTLLEAKIKQLREERSALAREVESERSMSLQAARTVEEYKRRVDEKDAEIGALQEQLRDLMIHMESQQRLVEASTSELARGTISLGSSAPRPPARSRRHR